jgi:hypothetical protein
MESAGSGLKAHLSRRDHRGALVRELDVLVARPKVSAFDRQVCRGGERRLAVDVAAVLG